MRKIVHHVDDADLRDGIGRVLDDFETHALPRFPELRAQVIHSDLNPDNVLTAAGDDERVAGVIDFGDMLHAPLVADVAIGACYLRAMEGNPLAKVAEFVAGYDSVTPLELAEIDLILDLIRARIAASVTILSWRLSMRGEDDPYLAGGVASEGDSAAFLRRLLDYPREAASRTLRQVCASREG